MSPLFDPELSRRISDCGIVAVLILERVDDAVPVARSLVAGGVTAMELTLRTPVALEALEKVRGEVPEMLAGVGTILTPEQVHLAKNSGAQYGVAPGTNPRVLLAARDAGLSFAPGVVTPSDIEAALEHECRLFKFFPAEPSGGLAYLDSIAAPYLHLGIKFLPLGGLNPDQYGELSCRSENRRAGWLMAGIRSPYQSGLLERDHQACQGSCRDDQVNSRKIRIVSAGEAHFHQHYAWRCSLSVAGIPP